MAQSEAAFQQECVMWFHNTYPSLRGLLFHVRNNSSNIREGAYWKALGVYAGVSDLIFLYDGFCHLIELKTIKGYQSPEQIEWQELVENEAIEYVIINSTEKFKAYIKSIIRKT